MKRRRLRCIETVDFRKSEHTNYLELMDKRPELKNLKQEDAVMLRSLQGGQIVILHGFQVVSDNRGIHQVLHSERLRLLDNSGWNGLMIADYGRHVGIAVVRLKPFDVPIRPTFPAAFPDQDKEVAKAMKKVEVAPKKISVKKKGGRKK